VTRARSDAGFVWQAERSGLWSTTYLFLLRDISFG